MTPAEKAAAEAMARANNKLRMEYINGLPQPFMARFCGGDIWPVESIEVQCALVRIDVCGMLEVKSFAEVTDIIDAAGVHHDPETFWSDYVQAADPDQDDCDDEADCGLGSDGQCANAGTEWCDWDCGRLG